MANMVTRSLAISLIRLYFEHGICMDEDDNCWASDKNGPDLNIFWKPEQGI